MKKNMHLLGRTPNLLACGALLSLTLCSLRADLVLEYNFDEGTGTAVADSSGFGTAADGTIVVGSGTGWSTDTPSGTGFSFDNPGVTNDRVTTAGAVSKLSGDQVSIVTWLKLESAPGSGDRILSNLTTTGGTTGFSFQFFSPTSGTIATDNYQVEAYFDGATFGGRGSVGVDGWVFLVSTYDNASGESKFYLGTQFSSVVQIGPTTIVAGDIAVGLGGNLTVGNTDLNLARTPDALFDSVQVYNEVLGLPALESLRLSAIPEPATSVLLLGLCVGAAAAFRRRRKIALHL